jgi:hypothetical protein
MHRHPARWAIIGLAAAVLSSGCNNLPRGVNGRRCTTVGAHAHDGTWVLKCSAKKTWVRLMTVADANNAVANWLRSQVPPPAPVTTPTPAPHGVTQFGTVESKPVGNGASDIIPGRYSTSVPDNTLCDIRATAQLPARRRLGWPGPMYFEAAAGDLLTTVGPCTWTLGEPGPQPIRADGTGMYRVGVDLPMGRYTARGAAPTTLSGPISNCSWEISTSADGSPASITDIYSGDGPQLAALETGDAYFTSNGCGPWTRLDALPPTYVEMIGSAENWILRGHRGFYTGADLEIVTYPNQINPAIEFRAGGFQILWAMPESGVIPSGSYPIEGSAPDRPEFDLVGRNRSCALTGTQDVSGVRAGPDGLPTSLRLVVVGECGEEPFALRAQLGP